MTLSPVPAEGPPAATEAAGVSLTIRRFEERLAKDPASPVFASLADAYRKAGRLQDAVKLCRDGLERTPDHATARLVLAKALLDQGDAAAAHAEVRRLLERDPRDAAAHRLAGEMERRAGRLPESLHHLRRAIELDSADRESRMLVEMLDGGKVGAASPLSRLLGDDTFSTMSFGAVCLDQGLVDEAAHIFVRILGKEPGHAGALSRLDEAVRTKRERRKGS
jgi:tetratricopeptide (TPR) repeat protein